MESLPATLTIFIVKVKNGRAIPDSGQLTLTWVYSDTDASKFRIYSAASSPPTAVLDSVSGSTRSYLHSGLTNGTTRYYKIEAGNSGDTVGGISQEFSAYPQKMGSMMNLVGYWHERNSYGGIL